MTLPSSGVSISLSQVNTELGLGSSATITMNDAGVRSLTRTAASANEPMSSLYGLTKFAITGQPSAITYSGASAGASATTGTTTVTVAGNGGYTYTWYVTGSGTINGQGSATASVSSSPANGTTNSGNLYCVVNDAGNGFSPITSSTVSWSVQNTTSAIPGWALFAGGTLANPYANTSKYIYGNDTSSAGTGLAAAKSSLAGAGNATIGVFRGGDYYGTAQSTTDIYTYSSDVVTAGAALIVAITGLAAAGTSTIAQFGGGFTTVNSLATEKYTYASNTRVAGNALGTARTTLAAAGNATVGIFSGGHTSVAVSVTDIYTHATAIRTAGSALGTVRQRLAAAGNTTVCIFAAGTTAALTSYTPALNTTESYTYSNNTRVGAAVLGYARRDLAATGYGAVGIFNGGEAYGTADKYTYSNNTVTTGSSLFFGLLNSAATSSVPGGF